MSTVLSDDAPAAVEPLFMSGFFKWYVGFGKEDEHPFIPRFDHADES